MTQPLNRDVVEIPHTLAVRLVGLLTGPDYIIRECQATLSLPKQVDTDNPLREFMELVKARTK